ncbi:MAG TPA: serine/threonine-protein kinase [Kofleriaceae bacterium]|nr:serine/threonine-protein kinase [Kofleriaceae bacterium]
MTSSQAQRVAVLGTLLGNYRILAKIGDGGMGEVYVGRHEAIGHRVAVKVLRPEMTRDADMVRRFYNEAQAATAVRHPGIVQIFDFGETADGRAYFVMELLEGQSLGARLKERRLEHAECCRLGRQAAGVLQAAHDAGITHRDLKPDNLFLVPDSEVVGGERVKVLDFGIAKLTGNLHSSGVATRTGLVMGTPHYMSPEQCRGANAVDARSDIYSLGCILFEVACGRPPFQAEGIGGILGAHQYVDPPQPRSIASDLPGKLAKLISQMLAKSPDARPQTMAAVSQALEEILSTLKGPSKRASTSLPPATRAAASTVASAVTSAAASAAASADTPTTLRGSAGATLTVARARGRWHPFALAGVIVVGAVVGIAVGVRGAGSPDPDEPAVAAALVTPLTADAATATTDAATAIGTTNGSDGANLAGSNVAAGPPPDAQVDASPPMTDAGTPEATPPTAPEPELIEMDPAAPPGSNGASGSNHAERSALELECRRYLSNRKWLDLDGCAERLKAETPAIAKSLKERAALEVKAAPRVAAFEAALKAKDLKKARSELDAISMRVIGYAKLKQSYEQAETAAIGEVAALLERVKGGDCKEYDKIAQQEKAVQPPRVVADAIKQVQCTPSAPPQPSQCITAIFAEQGKEHYAHGRLAAALASYEAAWTCGQDPQHAEKAFIVACNVSSLSKAKLFWKQLSPLMKQRAVMICVRNNITESMLNDP